MVMSKKGRREENPFLAKPAIDVSPMSSSSLVRPSIPPMAYALFDTANHSHDCVAQYVEQYSSLPTLMDKLRLIPSGQPQAHLLRLNTVPSEATPPD